MKKSKKTKQRLPKVHILKCWPEPFNAVYMGFKHHEIRVDDRNYQVGDHLLLKYWDPEKKKFGKKSMQVEITYKNNGGEWGLPKKLCVMAIQHIDIKGSKLCCAMLHPPFRAK